MIIPYQVCKVYFETPLKLKKIILKMSFFLKPLLFVVKASQQKRKTFKNERNGTF